MLNQYKTVKSGLTLLRDLDTAKSLAVSLMLQANDFSDFGAIAPQPKDYLDPYTYRKDAVAYALFKKLDAHLLGVTGLQDASYLKWIEAERTCADTNQRLAPLTGAGCDFHAAQQIVKRILGPLDNLALAAISDMTRHGPGASVGANGLKASPHRKMGSNPTITSDCIHLVRFFHKHAWIRAIHERKKDFIVVPGNELRFVPKDFRADRPIALEPTFNMYVQLGIGGYLRERFRRVARIDLNSGQQRHRALVKEGSLSGRFATLDLSSASDTVSLELVRLLLPPDWFLLLDAVRSKRTKQPDGTYVTLEKFSSMGNGFTFELESILFYALAKSTSKFVSTYGDDIIVDAASAQATMDILSRAGLIINQDKSFWDGNFFESCGADYFSGVPAHGIYVKKEPSDVLELYELANKLYSYSQYDPCFYFLYFRRARSQIIKMIPKKLRFFGPAHLGSCIHDDNTSLYTYEYKNSIRYVVGLERKHKRTELKKLPPSVHLALALSGIPSNGYVERNAPYKIVRRKYAWS